jgi:copper chaperone CopZ
LKKEIEIKVKGMHCNSCAAIIEDRLSEVEGVEKAKASYADENVKVVFDDQKTSLEKIEGELGSLGYPPQHLSPDKKSMSLKEGLIYGLVPHIGCIGFIVGSVLGVTVAVEFFKPLLWNPWFFHILILIALGFATISSVFYLRKNSVLSWKGVKRKKKYLATMYGATVGINLVLFIFIFPLLANLDTGSFANGPGGLNNTTPLVAGPTGAVVLADPDTTTPLAGNADSLLTLQVEIPCPGHAPLITGELKTIEGVTGVRFNFPNYFDVAFDSSQTSKEEILALEVFEPYPAEVVSESINSEEAVAEFQEVTEVSEVKEVTSTQNNAPSADSCDGSCGGTGSCGKPSCGCGAR